MSKMDQYVVFRLDLQRYALPLAAVDRTVRMVDITPLPVAPDAVSGIINLQGQVIPVFNLRRRFHLAERTPESGDILIIARTSRRTIALSVDDAEGVVGGLEKETLVSAEKILSGMEHIAGVIKLEDGMILIHNLDRFLSLNEEKELDDAISMKG